MVKKLLFFFISLIIIYVTTEWIVRAIYRLVIHPDTYLTFTLPLVHLTKYFLMATVVIITVNHFLSLAPAGRKVLPILLVISVLGIIVTSLWFNVVSEEKLIKHRVIWRTIHTWEDVEYVEPKIYREDPMDRPERVNQLAPLKVYTKYNIHFKNGSVLNAWDQLPNVYTLHSLIVEKNVEAHYNEMQLESFEQKYMSYFKDKMPEATFIFYGIKES